MLSGDSPEWTSSYLAHARPVRADGGVPQGPYGLQFLIGNVRCWIDASPWMPDESGRALVLPHMKLSLGASWDTPVESLLRNPVHEAVAFAAIENASPGNGIRCVESLSP